MEYLERWSSGLRHTLGKRARLTASAGSNPVLSARAATSSDCRNEKEHKIVLFF